ncbi:phosphoglycerate dehydrogenase-like enzyme [Microbacterium resistens]|uniref:Phosphoglycerate dehydrogenase-like enzyme n=1 Tax=Microbacterium resistens TaxID=156977 RepID=A0ABU1SB02_9MICO|nr:2-hydroxyacid dehydrogenase [Microbacterium resistens]MDR6866751.1 phosphoglycerate dehydrogenase-like enzyme [Microbacterium resistens]
MSLVVTVPSDRLAAGLGALPEGVELHVWDLRTPPPADRLDLVVPPYMGTTESLAALEGLDVGLVQSQSIGYDGVADALPAGMPFANAASVHEASTAELAVALMLAAQRQLPRFVRAQDRGEWDPVFADSLADRRVLLIGFGGVGTAIARRLAPFEVALSAVARTARPVSVDGIGEVAVHGLDELPRLLPDAEIVVLSLPGGEETRHFLDADLLSRMADGALLVNVGRGSIVDTDALRAELESGRLRAALDVLEEEPLPAGHPLWSAPNLLISPHVGGASTAMNPRIARLVRAQIDRLLRGEAPRNVVLPAR